MKKIIIGITICLITFLTILNIKNKESKNEEENENISIILETEEGNLETNNFPSKEDYEYSKVVCENTNNTVKPTFNSETWKLSLSIEEEVIDGNFNCSVYFKEKIKLASDVIISKYKENNDEGLIRINQPATVQTQSGTEYRYSGSNDTVKNYVNFNNETWRIIGVFPTDDGNGNIENRVKIIREESIGNYSWDTSDPEINSGYGINQWGESGSYNGADLMRLLNPGYESENINNSLYWNRESGTCYTGTDNSTTACDFSSTGLTEKSKGIIGKAKWYTASIDRNITTPDAYKNERGSTISVSDVGISITKTVSWVGDIGLMSPSDYGYASSSCYNSSLSLHDYNNSTCTNSNWLHNSSYQWMLLPFSNLANVALYVHTSGYVNTQYAYDSYSVRPTLYLSSSVNITGGTGTESDPYELSL